MDSDILALEFQTTSPRLPKTHFLRVWATDYPTTVVESLKAIEWKLVPALPAPPLPAKYCISMPTFPSHQTDETPVTEYVFFRDGTGVFGCWLAGERWRFMAECRAVLADLGYQDVGQRTLTWHDLL